VRLELLRARARLVLARANLALWVAVRDALVKLGAPKVVEVDAVLFEFLTAVSAGRAVETEWRGSTTPVRGEQVAFFCKEQRADFHVVESEGTRVRLERKT
jgi:hypothetical protein